MTNKQAVLKIYPKAEAVASTVLGITKYRIEDPLAPLSDCRQLGGWFLLEKDAWEDAAHNLGKGGLR